MASENKIEKNDQARKRSDGNEPGVWPGSGTTVEGHVDTATSGILGADPDRPRESASTSASDQEPDDRRAERRVDDPGPDSADRS